MTEILTSASSCLADHDHTQPPCAHAEWYGAEGVEWNDNGKRIVRPLTAEEIAQREADAAAFAEQQAAAEAEAAAKQAEKEAIAARLGLTADELKTLLS